MDNRYAATGGAKFAEIRIGGLVEKTVRATAETWVAGYSTGANKGTCRSLEN